MLKGHTRPGPLSFMVIILHIFCSVLWNYVAFANGVLKNPAYNRRQTPNINKSRKYYVFTQKAPCGRICTKSGRPANLINWYNIIFQDFEGFDSVRQDRHQSQCEWFGVMTKKNHNSTAIYFWS